MPLQIPQQPQDNGVVFPGAAADPHAASATVVLGVGLLNISSWISSPLLKVSLQILHHPGLHLCSSNSTA